MSLIFKVSRYVVPELVEVNCTVSVQVAFWAIGVPLKHVLVGGEALHASMENCPEPVPDTVGGGLKVRGVLPSFVTVSWSTFVPVSTVPKGIGFRDRLTSVPTPFNGSNKVVFESLVSVKDRVDSR